MRLEQRVIADALGTILMHNVADAEGDRVLKKGTRLTGDHLVLLAELGREVVDVAVLEADDVHEDEAALALAEVLRTEQLTLSRPGGGRVNLRSQVDGLLEVNA